jgi:two-component system alkaline phosphatase synthesis response regulator PhoP
MRVLVIDDEASARTILTTNLVAKGFDVRSVSSATDAISVLAGKTWKPDLLLLDYMMPRMTGDDVVDAMKVLRGLHQAPVIIVSASDEIPERLRRQALAVFRKPVDFSALLQAIRTLVPRP